MRNIAKMPERVGLGSLLRVVGLASSLLLLCTAAFSQESTGRIQGAVTDQTGGAVAGASVTVTDTQRGTARTLTADAAGEYNAPELTPGTYSVKATFQGFRETERDNIAVEVGKEYKVDLTLQPGEQTEKITVTEALPLVETTNAVLGGTISNQLIGDLPVQGRNFTKLLELRPGVYLAPGSGKWSQSSNGMRREHNVYILNGIDTIEGFSSQSVLNSTPVFGDATSILPIDAIQEFNTQENPKAEYGWKPGAIINVGLKSGTNTLHGTAYAFGRTSGLDAQNPFIISGNPKQETAIKDFGATVGGPIAKDKVFFLLGYEGQRNAIGSPSASLILPTRADLTPTFGSTIGNSRSVLDACNALPAATPPKDLSLKIAGLTYAGPGQCAVDPNNTGVFTDISALSYSNDPVGVGTLDNGLAKIDYHLNEKNTITGEYFVGNFDSLAPQNNAAAQDYWDTFTHAKSMVTGLHWTWLPTSTVVNEARGGFNRYNQLSYPGDCTNIPHPDYSYLANFNSDSLPMAGSGLPSNCGFPTISLGSPFASLGCCSSFPKIQGPDWTAQFLDSVSYIRGRHSFKVGYEMRHLTYNGGTYGGSKGSFSFNGITPFLTGTFNSTQPSELVGQPARHITEWGYAAFAQDDWRITDRVILNLGLRYETVTPFTDANNQIASFDPNSATGLVQASGGLFKRGNNFAPRVGFAWDVQGNAKWVLRGGGSIIYVIEGYNAFVSQQSIEGISVLGVNFDPTGALLGGVAGPGNITTGQVQFPSSGVGSPNWSIAGPVFPAGTLRCDSPLGVSPNNKPCAILTVDPNFKRPYAGEWNLSLQHAFSNDVSLQVAYVGSRGIDLMGLNDINAPAFGSGWATQAGASCVPLSAAAIATTVGAASSTTPSVSSTCENISRPYFGKFPYLSSIVQISNQDYSTYNALQATLTQRPWHGLSYLLGYTYGHNLAEANGDWNGSAIPTNPFNVRDDYGPSENDVRHRMTLSLTYALPDKRGYYQLLEGWKFNSISNLQSALPWTVMDTTNDISGLGMKNDKWNFYGDPTAFNALGNNPIPYSPGTSNPACASQAAALDGGFTPLHPGWTYTNALAKYGCYDQNGSLLLPPAFGTYGTMAPGLFRATPLDLWDVSVTKEVRFTERMSGQLRFEVFNILNHTNYTPSVNNTMSAGVTGTSTLTSLPTANTKFAAASATPDVQVSNPSVGSGAARGFQMGLKLSF